MSAQSPCTAAGSLLAAAAATSTSSAAVAAGMLSKEEIAALDDDAFFEAYRQGRVPRPAECLTEELWEEQIEQIPLLMTRPPEKIDGTSHPALQALAQMVHEETPPAELAEYVQPSGEKREGQQEG